MKTKTLGILGGVGPLASVYFADLIVNMTEACTDQEHIPLFLFNDNTIPDRTSFILGASDIDPTPRMIEDIAKLSSLGCDYIAVTCNTAHYFYNKLQASTSVTVVNMIDEAVNDVLKKIPEAKKIGVLATDGTVLSGVYSRVIKEKGMTCLTPSPASQKQIMEIIYAQIKAGKEPDLKAFLKVINELRHNGCDAIILGCTELSVINKNNSLTKNNDDIIDAMESLAKKCITLCGKEVKGETQNEKELQLTY